MTLRLIEGFELNRHATFWSRFYPTTSGDASTDFLVDGRKTGYAFGHKLANPKPYFCTKALSTSELNEWVLGFGFKAASVMGSGTQTNYTGFRFMDASDSQCLLYIVRNDDETVCWRLARGTILAGSTTLATSSPFNPLYWHYFEFKINVQTGTSGSYELKIHDPYSGEVSTILTGSGVNLAHQGTNGISRLEMRFHSEPAFHGYLDDIYFLDTGTGTHQTYLGDVVVLGILPDSQGDVTQWAPGGNSNWQRVDDPPLTPEDGNYVTAASTGLTDLYGYQIVSTKAGTVLGVQIETSSGLATAGTETIRHKIRDDDDNDNNGSSFTVDSTTIETVSEVIENDPQTTVAWTPARLDDMLFGEERIV